MRKYAYIGHTDGITEVQFYWVSVTSAKHIMSKTICSSTESRPI